jgi:hypothetical protein
MILSSVDNNFMFWGENDIAGQHEFKKCWGYNGCRQLGLGDTNTRGDASGKMGDNLPAVDLG